MAARGRHAYPDTKKLELKIEEYFAVFENEDGRKSDEYVKEGAPKTIAGGVPGISGLAFYLGVNRRTLSRWAYDKNLVRANLILKAKSRIEAAQEQALYDPETFRGAAFSLANNFDWRNRSESISPEGSHSSFAIRIIEPPMRNEEPLKFECAEGN